MVKKKVGKDKPVVKFPASVLKPVANFLTGEARKLELRRKNLSQKDPFNDPDRVVDNASPDTDANEQFGHQTVSALKLQIERQLIQIKKALTRIKIGKYGTCEVCGKMIDTDRLMVMPQTTLCAECAKKKEE